MQRPDAEPWAWRTVHVVALVLVLVALLLSLRAVLSPFVLFFLFLLLASPMAGTRTHLLLVGSTGLLTLVWLLASTGYLLSPFFLALAFAYIQHPLVRRIQGPRISRTLAVAILALPMLALLAVGVLVGVPALSEQVARFIQSVPSLLQTGVQRLDMMRLELLRRDLPLVNEEELLGRLRAIQPEAVTEYLETRRAAIAQRVWQGVLGAGRGLSSVLTVLGYVLLTPILTFYLLRDWDRIMARLGELAPRRHAPAVVGFAREYDALLSSYLRGQLLAAAIIGVLTGIGFWLVGFPYALLLGVVAGLFNVVPYLGMVVALIPAVLIALFSGAVLLSLGKVALVLVVVQLLEGAVISPRIVGESVGLHPVWVILAISVAGFFFGFVGLLLAIPLAVLIKMLLAAALARYRRSALFHGPEA